MTEDISLRIIRTTIFSIVVPHKEPCSSYKIKMEYKDMEGEDIPFSDYGHRNLDDFLRDHPMLNGMMQEGKWVFTAKMSERSANIQALVHGQKSKKRKGKKGNNNPFARNFAARSSYHGKPTLGQGDVRRTNASQPFNRNQSTYKSFTPGTYRPPTAPIINSNPSQSKNTTWGSQQSRPSSSLSSSSSNSNPPSRTFQPNPPRKFIPTLPPTRPSSMSGSSSSSFSRPAGPQEGMRRFNIILSKCKGAATLRVFCRLYAQEFNLPFNAEELKRHFNTVNLGEVINKYGNDKILVSSTPDGSVMFTDSQVLEAHVKAAKELEEKKKNSVVIEPEKKHSHLPSIKMMFDDLTDMLVDSFPDGIPLDDITPRYEKRAQVVVDPLTVFSHTWKELIEKKFNSRVRIENGKAVLTPTYIKANNLHAKGERKKQTLVTLDDLGMIFVDESSQDDDDEEDDESQSETTSQVGEDIRNNKNNWRAPPTGYGSMCSSVSSSVQALNASPRDLVISEEKETEEVDDLTEKMRAVKVEMDKDSPREITIAQSSPRNGESLARRNLMQKLDETVNGTLKKEEPEKEEKPIKNRTSFFSKLSFAFGGSRNTASASIASSTVKDESKEAIIHPSVTWNPPGELKVKATGEYKSFSFTVDSKDVYAYKVTCKNSLYRVIGGCGFSNVGSTKLMQIMREDGPVGVTTMSVAFVKRRTGDMRISAHIIDASTADFTIEYVLNAQ